jgi:voltage-gated potassium channel
MKGRRLALAYGNPRRALEASAAIVRSLYRRLFVATLALASVLLLGSCGFWWIGHGRWSIGECAYMTAIAISTVGFGETLPGMDQIPQARAWAVLMILM